MSRRATSLFKPGLMLVGLFLVAILAVVANTGQAADFPTLTIPKLIPALKGQPVVVPLVFDAGTANNVNTFVFDIRYETEFLTLDPTDDDSNNIPDSIDINVPDGFSVSISDSVGGGVGSLFVTIVNVSSPLAGMPSQTIMAINFVAGIPDDTTITNVSFATSPSPFFANKQGLVISGLFDGGSVKISDDPLPTLTPTATATKPGPTATATSTGGPISVAFYMPAVIYSFTPTSTPTATSIPPTATATTVPPTNTATTLPPTATGTNVPPTATATVTKTPPAATATATSKPPTTTPGPSTSTPKSPTATPGPACGDLILNGGMESDSGWVINVNAFPASYVSGTAHSGNRSMRIGIVNYWDNRYSYSSVQQGLTIPQSSTNATLRFWLLPTTTGTLRNRITPPPVVPTEFTDGDGTLLPLADDVQMVLLFDQAGNQHNLLFQRQNFGNWAYYEMNLNAFVGQQVTLYFGVFNNGTGGITGMYLDDVSLTYCN